MLVRGGRVKDLCRAFVIALRGSGYAGVIHKQGRSKYGAKRPEAAQSRKAGDTKCASKGWVVAAGFPAIRFTATSGASYLLSMMYDGKRSTAQTVSIAC